MKSLSLLGLFALPLLLACGGSSSNDTVAATSGASTTGSGGDSSLGGQGGKAGAGGQGGAGAASPDAAAEVTALLTGRFDSGAQSQSKPSYFSVNLLGCSAPAPELGTHVLYIEQALSSNLSAPYRQRLYVINAGNNPADEARSNVYSLKNPEAFVGYCGRANKATIVAAQAVERSGCHVVLSRKGDVFEGGTEGKDCASSMNGASYATSEVILHGERIESWDRGFDAADQQVWGATAGAYVFDRKTPLGEQPE